MCDIHSNENPAQLKLKLAEHYLDIDQPQKCIEVLQGLDTFEEVEEDIITLTALAQYNLGQKQDSYDTCRKGLAINPLSHSLLELAADTSSQLGDQIEAENLILRALEEYPYSSSLYVCYASILLASYKFEEAEKMIIIASEMDPGSQEVKAFFFQMQTVVDNQKHAKSLALSLLENDPDSVIGHLGLATYYLNRGQVTQAKKHALIVAEQNPGSNTIAEIARSVKLYSHFLYIPIRPVLYFGIGGFWLLGIITMLTLVAFASSETLMLFFKFYFAFLLYTWVMPTILETAQERRWI